MATLIRPPKDFHAVGGIVGSVFLAGSIEMGKAKDWQTKVWDGVKNIPGLGVLNPRRDSWDSSWKQEITNKKFKQQVEWELGGIESCDLVIFYFDPKTQSPITMAELGLVSHRFTNFSPEVIVCCPDGFWRKGNVDIICERYHHTQAEDLNTLIKLINKKFEYLFSFGKEFDIASCSIGWNRASKGKKDGVK